MRKKLLELPTENPQSAALFAKENNIRILILINNIERIKYIFCTYISILQKQ